MSELSPEAQALLDAARSDAPRAGLQAALKADIVAKAASTAGTTAAVSGATALKVGSVAAVAAVAAWVAVAQLSPEPSPERESPVLVEATPEPAKAEVEALVVVEVPEAEVEQGTVEPEPVAVQPRTAAKTRAQSELEEPSEATAVETLAAEAPVASSLAAETRLLQGMRSALAADNWPRARFLAEAHAKQFPEGLLTAERLVVAARAACALGDADAASAARAELVRRLPGSAYVADVDKACAQAR